MKKILALFLCALALASLFALPACDGGNDNKRPNGENGTEWPDDWTNNY